MLELPQLGPVSVAEKRELLKNLLDLQASAATGLIPLTLGQMSLWFLYQLAPESPAYNFLYAARIKTMLDLGVFRQACWTLADRHPLLRARFTVQDHKPIQQIESTPALDIAVTDASGWSEEHLLEVLRQRADLPFRLEQVPCLRIELFQRSQTEAVLLLVFPHIIADLWSADLLLQELRELYTAFQQGKPARLPAGHTAAQLADVVRWQMMQAHTEQGQKSRHYWHQVLSGELPVLALPTDRPRPAIQTYNGTAYSWSLQPEVVRRVRSLAAEQGSTPFSALLAAFQLLLHRLSGQDDILVGTAVANRDRPEWERMVGYFLNQVVFRGQFASNRSFRRLLEETRDQVHGALEHQSYPFGLLVKQLHPRRDPARPPIFQVMFIWDKPRNLGSGSSGQGPSLEMETLLMEQRGAPFDLTLILFEIGDQLTACFRYSSDLFDAATIQRWAGHFDTLLESLVREPDALFSEAPILSDAEQKQILVEWNRTETPYPAYSFPELFEQQVIRTPAAAALAFTNGTWSYDELNRRANQLAHYLLGKGIQRGDIVALSMPRGPDLVVSLLAVWKAGAAHLFLDPGYPPLRLESLIAETRPALLLGSAPDHAGAIPTVTLENAWPEIQQLSDSQPPRIGLTPEDWAYIICTSGSTGQPKAVVLRHRGLSNLLTAQQQVLRLGRSDRVLQFASFSFDAAVWEVVSALGCGSTLVLTDPASLLPGWPLWQFLHDQAITCMTLPPSALALLPTEPLPALKTLVVAGEACSAKLVASWAPGRRFLNAYGPTEATVCATVSECVAKDQPPTIGRPIANTRVYVLDQHFQPAPVGVAGELYLAGPGLALGYLNRPEATAQRFLPCPFSQADEATMYHTGDVVRWTVEGQLEFLGRADHQVKVRGYRIELEEIQAVLTGSPAVLDAVVQVRPGTKEAGQLAAYVIPRPGSEFSLPALRAYLRERLPHYMLPAAIVPLESFPRGSTGKVDRSRLPEPSQEATPQPAVYTNGYHAEDKGNPRNPMERLLAQIWSRVLSVARVGVHDNFFELGGASLQVLEVVTLASARESG